MIRFHRLTSKKNNALYKQFKRLKGGGGASSGGGGGFGGGGMSSSSSRQWIMPAGYRFCGVCGYKDQRCLVPLYQGPVSVCEAKGVMCETAEYVRIWEWVKIIGGLFVFGWLSLSGGSTDFEIEDNRAQVAQEVRDVEYDNDKSLRAHQKYVEQGQSRNLCLSSSEHEHAWLGTYKERGATGHTYYTIRMWDPDYSTSLGSFEGSGRDNDGRFRIKNAVYSTKTGRFAWAEHSVNSNLVATCELECVDEACVEMEGFYRASTGLGGSLKLRRKLAPDKERKSQDAKVDEQKEVRSFESSENDGEKEREDENEKVEEKGWFSFLSTEKHEDEEEKKDEEKKDEWVQTYDEDSGKHYYWNRKTQQTTWDEPETYVTE